MMEVCESRCEWSLWFLELITMWCVLQDVQVSSAACHAIIRALRPRHRHRRRRVFIPTPPTCSSPGRTVICKSPVTQLYMAVTVQLCNTARQQEQNISVNASEQSQYMAERITFCLFCVTACLCEIVCGIMCVSVCGCVCALSLMLVCVGLNMCLLFILIVWDIKSLIECFCSMLFSAGRNLMSKILLWQLLLSPYKVFSLTCDKSFLYYVFKPYEQHIFTAFKMTISLNISLLLWRECAILYGWYVWIRRK